MPAPSIHSYIPDLLSISRAAGEAIMQVYHKADQGIEIKMDHSPVTAADHAANRIICEGLARVAPSIPIISEENEATDYAIRSCYQQYWLVDPLDGTKEFIKGNDEFTVNIALIEGGIPTLGVVFAPALRDMYYGGGQAGAFHVSASTAPRRIYSRPATRQDTGLRIVVSRSHMDAKTTTWIDQLDNPVVIPCGSSLKMTMIADGKADIYPKLGPTMEWDTAAADAILQAAGGSIIQLDSGKPLAYNKVNLTNPHFIASGRKR